MNARRLFLLGLFVTTTNACAATTGDASSSDSAIASADAPALANATYAGTGDFRQISDNPDYSKSDLVVTPAGLGTVTIKLTGSTPAQQELEGTSTAEPTYTASLRVDYPAGTHKDAFVREGVTFAFSPWSQSHRALELPREIEVFFVATNGKMARVGTSADASVPGLNDRLELATNDVRTQN